MLLHFPRGDDFASPFFTFEALAEKRKAGALDIAICYGGVGDARHFYLQLQHLHHYLSTCNECPCEAHSILPVDKVRYLLSAKNHGVVSCI